MPNAREVGCRAQAASNAARKLIGDWSALVVPDEVPEALIACAAAVGGNARKSQASAGITAQPRLIQFRIRRPFGRRMRRMAELMQAFLNQMRLYQGGLQGNPNHQKNEQGTFRPARGNRLGEAHFNV